MTKAILTTAYWTLSHLGWWLLMLGAAATAGDLCLRRWQFHSWLERFVFTIATGLGLLSLLWFVLGLCGLLYPALLLVVTLLLAGYGLWSRRSDIFRAHPFQVVPGWLREEWLRSKWALTGKLLALALLAVYEMLLVWTALFPPTAWDATMYHLPLAREYLNTHGLTAHMGLPYPVVPALNHLLFSWGLALQDDLLPPLIEHSFLILTAGGLIAWGWRLQNLAVGLAAAALWLAHPLVLLFQGTAYVDMGVSCYAFLAVYALRNFRETSGSGWWLLAVSLAAMAAGTKMIGLVILAAIAGWGLWAYRQGWLQPRQLLQGWGLGALLVLPWYGFIAYHAGNPVWPMLPALSQGWWREWSLYVEAWGRSIGVPRTLWNFLTLPITVVRQPERFFPDNNLGLFAAVALFPLAWLVSWRDRSVRWWTSWALFLTAVWFASFQALRYLFPALPLIGLALCESGDWLLRRVLPRQVIRSVLWGVVIAGVAFTSFSFLKDSLSGRGWKPPVTSAEREAWLSNTTPSYAGVKYVNAHTAPGDTVYLIGGTRLPYHLQPRLVRMEHSVNTDASGTALQWPGDAAWLERLLALDPTWIFISHEGLRVPEQTPFDGSEDSRYELVYTDTTAQVFRRTPVPEQMAQNIPRLQQKDCVADSATAQPVYEGRLDGITCQGAWGWVWRLDQPNCPLKLEIYDNSVLLTTVLANEMRADLVAAGKGNGRHGFTFNWPPQWADGQPHTISVKVAGAARELTNSPLAATCAPIVKGE